MPCRVLNLNKTVGWGEALHILDARNQADPALEGAVKDIIARVAAEGDAALVDFTRCFDCPDFKPGALRVSEHDLDAACAVVPEDDLAIIDEAAVNIREFHEACLERSWFNSKPDGSILGQAVRAVGRAGLYVPGGQGGKTPLISSLLMTAIPAQVAGVAEIAVVSPPAAGGGLNPYILAAARLIGLKEIYAVGGPWAIAALALGTQSIKAVDVIAGPGNAYVTEAKRQLMGRVGIDMLAGPSEILIIADAGASPVMIAADMLSQAEHDSRASAVLITDEPNLIPQVRKELAKQLKDLPRVEIAAEALRNFGLIILTPNLGEACDLANAAAPEHLELLVSDPWTVLPLIRNAGAVFMGDHAAEVIGDYFAGPNHVLPTMRTARFSSALSVQTFSKRISLIATSPDYARANADKIARLARLEGLEAHARSVETRKQKGP